MTAARSLAQASSPAEVLTRRAPPEESVAAIRAMLLGGFGTGASDARVLAVTRDREAIGGMSTTARRARTARRTRDQREGPSVALSRFEHGVRRAIISVAVPVIAVRVVRMFRQRG